MRSSNNPSYDKCVPLFDFDLLNPGTFPNGGSNSWDIDCRGIVFINATGGSASSYLRLQVTNGDGSTCQFDLPDGINSRIFLIPLHIKVTDIDDGSVASNHSAFGLI